VAYPLREHLAKTKFSAANLTALWTDLAGSDVPKAWAAVEAIAAAPNGVVFLKERIQPVRAAAKNEITKRIEKLSSASYDEREQATRELADMSEAAQAELELALKRDLEPEARRRVQTLLDTPHNPNLTGERLRQWRAVAMLERIGSSEAAKVLDDLASGMPEARLTIAAKDARDRLRERQTAPQQSPK